MSKIRNKLIFSFLLVAIFAALSIGGYAMHTITTVISDLTIEQQESRVSLISKSLEDYLENALLDLSFLRETAAIKRVREGISSGSKRE
ncbi:MAG: hypothetical protein ACE5FU_11660, partial [Nitrospinota bacterium]